MVENTLATNNTIAGIRAGDVAVVRVANSVIVNNSTGLLQRDSAVLLSRGDNTVEGNGTDLSGTVGLYSPR